MMILGRLIVFLLPAGSLEAHQFLPLPGGFEGIDGTGDRVVLGQSAIGDSNHVIQLSQIRTKEPDRETL
jgi:hypothetical protein